MIFEKDLTYSYSSLEFGIPKPKRLGRRTASPKLYLVTGQGLNGPTGRFGHF